MKRVIVSVSNDLSTDQRVRKVCQTLHEMGWQVYLIGRQLPNSLPINDRPYDCYRFKLLFNKGPLFYAEFNLRLFFKLLILKADVFHANDLDTLLANYFSSIIMNKPIVYDSHEYFLEVPELQNRPMVKKVWKTIENFIFPKLKHIITVNESIAKLYENDYGIKPVVVRNVTDFIALPKLKNKSELGMPIDKKIIILQGAGINIDRGAEEAVEAMQYLNDSILLIIGSGDVINDLKQRVKDLELADKVIFLPKMSYTNMMEYTRNADLGLTLDKDSNINYRYSLPNKLFDYIHAGIPTLATNLPEVTKIVEEYKVGSIVNSYKPEVIAVAISEILSSKTNWKINCELAASKLKWDIEKLVIKRVYSNIYSN